MVTAEVIRCLRGCDGHPQNPPDLYSYDEAQVVQEAAAAGVGVYPGAGYHLQPDLPPSILLGFSGLTTAEIEEGVRRLSTVLC